MAGPADRGPAVLCPPPLRAPRRPPPSGRRGDRPLESSPRRAASLAPAGVEPAFPGSMRPAARPAAPLRPPRRLDATADEAMRCSSPRRARRAWRSSELAPRRASTRPRPSPSRPRTPSTRRCRPPTEASTRRRRSPSSRPTPLGATMQAGDGTFDAATDAPRARARRPLARDDAAPAIGRRFPSSRPTTSARSPTSSRRRRSRARAATSARRCPATSRRAVTDAPRARARRPRRDAAADGRSRSSRHRDAPRARADGASRRRTFDASATLPELAPRPRRVTERAAASAAPAPPLADAARSRRGRATTARGG